MLTATFTTGFLVWAAWYALACRLWPLKPCYRCHGSGKIRSFSRNAWRRCRRCNATGGRPRMVLQVWHVLHRRAGR